MSIDVDIAALNLRMLTWGELRRAWLLRLGSAGPELLGPQPRLLCLEAHRVVDDAEPLELGFVGYFELEQPGTLSLFCGGNALYLDERDYLDDYGRNLTAATIEELVGRWRGTPWHVGLTSYGGRPRHELELLAALACAVADLTDGRVFLMHEGVYDLAVGVYTADEFARARRC